MGPGITQLLLCKRASPPPTHTHTHTPDTHNKFFILLTLLALDVQTLRTSYKGGFSTKAINSMNAIFVIIFRAETHPFPRHLVCNHDRLNASPRFPPPMQFGIPLNTPKWACPWVKISHLHIFNFGPSPLQFLDPPLKGVK